MKTEEVLERLAELGVVITERTLQRYVKIGLIPKPERKSAGRGKGRITDYPPETPAEAYASHKILHSKDLKPTPQYLAEALKFFRNKDCVYNENDPDQRNKAAIYVSWVIHLTDPNLKWLQASIEEKTKIKAQSIKAVFIQENREEEIKIKLESAERIEKRNHGDIKVTYRDKGEGLIEYWNGDCKKWVKVEID